MVSSNPIKLVMIFISLLTSLLMAPLPDTERPNILFIMVDDLGKEWVSCYGGEEIETPHIDQLAAEGMKFENAWSMPQCTPTRVTLLTGQYPFRHGWTNHWDVPRWGARAHFDPRVNPSYPLVLRGAGYKTVAAGKWQIDDFRVEPRAMHQAGFDAWCMWTGYETGNPPSAKRFWDPYVATNGSSKTHEGAFGPDVYCDFLIDYMKEHRSEPMLLYFPMTLTHAPLTSTPDQPDAEGPSAFPGMVRYTDQLVGRLVTALNELGIRDRTYIVFTTDNGTGMGLVNQRLGQSVPAAKAKLVEAGTAMPFIVTGPGIDVGVTTDALIDFTDIAPTFVDLAGAVMPDVYPIDGKSFAPLLRAESKDSARQWILSMGGFPARLSGGRVVPMQDYDDRVLRDKRYKVWVDTKAQIHKLFDMQDDPKEQHNLIDSENPKHREALQRLGAIVASLPGKDAAPAYELNPPQPWDRKK